MSTPTWQGVTLGQMFSKLANFKDSLTANYAKLQKNIKLAESICTKSQEKVTQANAVINAAENLVNNIISDTTKVGIWILAIEPEIGGTDKLKDNLKTALITGDLEKTPKLSNDSQMIGVMMVIGAPSLNGVKATYDNYKKLLIGKKST